MNLLQVKYLHALVYQMATDQIWNNTCPITYCKKVRYHKIKTVGKRNLIPPEFSPCISTTLWRNITEVKAELNTITLAHNGNQWSGHFHATTV